MNEPITRRTFAAAGSAAAIGALTLTAHGEEETMPPELKSELLFEMEADLEPPQVIGATPDGPRQNFYVTGGWVKGPKINATVLPGGGDWLRVRSDGVAILDVRATIKTDDDALIYVTYNGMVHGDYFRTVPWFQTASEKYAWLNKLIAVGVRKPTPQGKVGYYVFQIL